MMTLELIDSGGDCRGKILFFKFNQTKTNLFEIKKGFARGGHFHDYDITHTLIIGKIEHRMKSLTSKQEKIEIITAPAIIKIPAKTANLIIALDDSLFSEIFESEYKSTTFPEYREIVLQKMKEIHLMESNTLKITNQLEDLRGKIFFCKLGEKNINLIEIKKGFARGGHFHKFNSEHIILSGKIKYLEKNLNTNIESKQIIDHPKIILTTSMIAHMFIGLETSLFVESFTKDYEAVYYLEYRRIIDEKMN
jgi:hypothetical protein